MNNFIARVSLKSPFIIAIIVFFSGILNIYSAFFIHHPVRASILNALFSVSIRHTSRTFVVIAGFFLIFLAQGIYRRKFRAWLVTLVVLILSLIFHLFQSLNIEEVFLLLLPIALLWLFRSEFKVRSATTQLVDRIKISAISLLVLFLYSTFGFFLLQGQFNAQINIPRIYYDYEYSIFGVGEDSLVPTTKRAQWFEESISIFGWATLLFVILIVFGPRLFLQEITEEDLNKIKKLVLLHGMNPICFFVLMDDKKYFFNQEKTCIISYKIKNNVAVVLGDPIGPESFIEKTLNEFIDYFEQHGYSVCFYQISEKYQSFFSNIGYKSIKIGEDAILQITNFTLEGPEMKNIRNSYNSVKKKGVTFQWFSLSEIPWSVMRHIQYLYSSWITSKGQDSLSFSLGFFPFPAMSEGKVLVAYDDKHNLIGAFSFFPFKQMKGMNLDLMLKNSLSSPNGFVETAIIEAVNYFKQHGVEFLSLGLAIANNTKQLDEKEPLAQKMVNILYGNFKRFNSYLTLVSFKQKFNPIWEPRFLVYKNEIYLPKIAIALVQVHVKK